MPTILVTDDHPQVREVVRAMLESRGFTVLMAGDGTAALAALDRVQVDAALVDVDMPGMSGVELIREMRGRSAALGRSLPAALMTGVPRPELDARAVELEIAAILVKPFATATVVALLDRLCHRGVKRRAAA